MPTIIIDLFFFYPFIVSFNLVERPADMFSIFVVAVRSPLSIPPLVTSLNVKYFFPEDLSKKRHSFTVHVRDANFCTVLLKRLLAASELAYAEKSRL